MVTHNRKSLRTLSPDLIEKASDETATQVTRILLTFVGTAVFCLLSLLSPDSALLGGSEKLNVPFAGPVSFFGFMLLGPAVLIVLRVYLQIYVEHSNRLGRIARRVPVVRAPTLVPLKNSLIRWFNGLTFYLLLPLVMLLFALKAAVFPWGLALFCVAIGVIASHAMLPLHKISWPARGLLSLSATLVAAGIMVGILMHGYWPFRRAFNLDRANLAGQWLVIADLSGASLYGANLESANLQHATLAGASLLRANLRGADLHGADLSHAGLSGADLSHADLSFTHLSNAYLSGVSDRKGEDALEGANLTGAKLHGADLSDSYLSATNLTGADLSGANLSSAHVGTLPARGELISQGGANLAGASFSGANLSGADLSDAKLSDAKDLTQSQLDQACGTDAKLPAGLTLKPCPIARLGDKKPE